MGRGAIASFSALAPEAVFAPVCLRREFDKIAVSRAVQKSMRQFVRLLAGLFSFATVLDMERKARILIRRATLASLALGRRSGGSCP